MAHATLSVQLVRTHATIDRILERWERQLGDDAVAYRGHVYRMFNFGRALLADDAVDEPLAIAAAYHDLGIWSDGTFDYLEPSARRAREYLAEVGKTDDADDVANMILWHHRLRSCLDVAGARAEAFRRADLIDVSLGTVAFGLPRQFVREVRRAFPNAGFHRCLLGTGLAWFVRHPVRPFPMMRW